MSSPFQIFLAYFGAFLSKSGHFLTKIRKNERSLSTFFIPPCVNAHTASEWWLVTCRKFEIRISKSEMVRQAHHPERSRRTNSNVQNTKLKRRFFAALRMTGRKIADSVWRIADRRARILDAGCWMLDACCSLLVPACWDFNLFIRGRSR